MKKTCIKCSLGLMVIMLFVGIVAERASYAQLSETACTITKSEDVPAMISAAASLRRVEGLFNLSGNGQSCKNTWDITVDVDLEHQLEIKGPADINGYLTIDGHDHTLKVNREYFVGDPSCAVIIKTNNVTVKNLKVEGGGICIGDITATPSTGVVADNGAAAGNAAGANTGTTINSLADCQRIVSSQFQSYCDSNAPHFNSCLGLGQDDFIDCMVYGPEVVDRTGTGTGTGGTPPPVVSYPTNTIALEKVTVTNSPGDGIKVAPNTSKINIGKGCKVVNNTNGAGIRFMDTMTAKTDDIFYGFATINGVEDVSAPNIDSVTLSNNKAALVTQDKVIIPKVQVLMGTVIGTVQRCDGAGCASTTPDAVLMHRVSDSLPSAPVLTCSSTAAIAVTDAKGKIASYIEKMSQLFGLSVDEIKEKACTALSRSGTDCTRRSVPFERMDPANATSMGQVCDLFQGTDRVINAAVVNGLADWILKYSNDSHIVGTTLIGGVKNIADTGNFTIKLNREVVNDSDFIVLIPVWTKSPGGTVFGSSTPVFSVKRDVYTLNADGNAFIPNGTSNSGTTYQVYDQNGNPLYETDVGIDRGFNTVEECRSGKDQLGFGILYFVDSDHDTVPDVMEDLNGNCQFDRGQETAWNNPDTDGDGLSDGLELGAPPYVKCYTKTQNSLYTETTKTTGLINPRTGKDAGDVYAFKVTVTDRTEGSLPLCGQLLGTAIATGGAADDIGNCDTTSNRWKSYYPANYDDSKDFCISTNPQVADTDYDGLSDGRESRGALFNPDAKYYYYDYLNNQPIYGSDGKLIECSEQIEDMAQGRQAVGQHYVHYKYQDKDIDVDGYVDNDEACGSTPKCTTTVTTNCCKVDNCNTVYNPDQVDVCHEADGTTLKSTVRTLAEAKALAEFRWVLCRSESIQPSDFTGNWTDGRVNGATDPVNPDTDGDGLCDGPNNGGCNTTNNPYALPPDSTRPTVSRFTNNGMDSSGNWDNCPGQSKTDNACVKGCVEGLVYALLPADPTIKQKIITAVKNVQKYEDINALVYTTTVPTTIAGAEVPVGTSVTMRDLPDTDRDGIPDVVEDPDGTCDTGMNSTFLKPFEKDTDNDGKDDKHDFCPWTKTVTGTVTDPYPCYCARDAASGIKSDPACLDIPHDYSNNKAVYFFMDWDDDGLANGREDKSFDDILDAIETDPHFADTDRDGLDDKTELFGMTLTALTKTDPRNADTDADGITDGNEVKNGDLKVFNPPPAGYTNTLTCETRKTTTILIYDTDPTKADSDGDGLKDGLELTVGTDPNDPDSDHDGLCDGNIKVEGRCVGTELRNVQVGDTLVKGLNETNPCLFDTDGDTYNDSEDNCPNTVDRTNSCTRDVGSCGEDKDGDGVPDVTEVQLNTSSDSRDSDNDGLVDGCVQVNGKLEGELCNAMRDCFRSIGSFQECNPPDYLDCDTNPMNEDTDGDGEKDYKERHYNGSHFGLTATPMNPLNPDTDGDCVLDGLEDSNHNGIWEINETAASAYDTTTSTDLAIDTDGDGLPDGLIRGLGEDLDCNGTNIDTSGNIYETDPTSPDTDNDGQDDYSEMTEGGGFSKANLSYAVSGRKGGCSLVAGGSADLSIVLIFAGLMTAMVTLRRRAGRVGQVRKCVSA